MFKKSFSALVGLAISTVFVPHAPAAYINNFGSLGAEGFTTLGSVFWDPGVDTARIGGNPAPGGATWSMMGAGIGDSGLGSDPHGGALTTLLTSLYAGGVDEMTTIGLTLDKWALVSGFSNLGMVVDGGGAIGAAAVGDIRVGAIFIDGAIGPNTLAHAFAPGTIAIYGDTYGGDTHFDNSNSWSDGGIGGTIDFHTVALHEFGHALGLGHSAVAGSVMEPIYTGSRRILQADDISGIQSIYGLASVSVPEPGSLALLSIGIAGLFSVRRRSIT